MRPSGRKPDELRPLSFRRRYTRQAPGSVLVHMGRSLRAVVDLEKLSEHTLWIDCDVLEADGGTRTASINGAYIALIDALASKKAILGPPARIVRGSVAAISVGLWN